MKYSYDKESDILSVFLSKKPFDYAEEMGDLIVHFDKKNKPVYVEILNGSKFLANTITILPKSSRDEIDHHLHAA